ncbi:hypothetical protein [Catenovulum maritimum]|uniref:Uncharacterized protein n=1 Tax=Catenovulum maritimum TaxID=1513271 RepID=A0A0J8GMP7_9ALTE|nr:hypothetical protein [Catenovulum maritimum]KMT64052.1 hypothetical protein XM47_16450 [Catenovulum maritimum]
MISKFYKNIGSRVFALATLPFLITGCGNTDDDNIIVDLGEDAKSSLSSLGMNDTSGRRLDTPIDVQTVVISGLADNETTLLSINKPFEFLVERKRDNLTAEELAGNLSNACEKALDGLLNSDSDYVIYTNEVIIPGPDSVDQETGEPIRDCYSNHSQVVMNGDKVTIRVRTSPEPQSELIGRVNFGDTVESFSVITGDKDLTPEEFVFYEGTQLIDNPFSGLVAGREYQINFDIKDTDYTTVVELSDSLADLNQDGFKDTDENNDGLPDEDLNQDGFIDVDLNADSKVDKDDNNDGFIDVDNNTDGTIDLDINSDGFIDIDVNDDGIVDVDTNSDGYIDVDLDGDLTPDTYIDVNNDGVLDRTDFSVGSGITNVPAIAFATPTAYVSPTSYGAPTAMPVLFPKAKYKIGLGGVLTTESQELDSISSKILFDVDPLAEDYEEASIKLGLNFKAPELAEVGEEQESYTITLIVGDKEVIYPVNIDTDISPMELESKVNTTIDTTLPEEDQLDYEVDESGHVLGVNVFNKQTNSFNYLQASTNVYGINALTKVSISGGEYRVKSVDGTLTEWTSADGFVDAYGVILYRAEASQPDSTYTVVLTVGEGDEAKTTGFTFNTEAADTTPNAFSILSKDKQKTNKLVESDTFTVNGFNTGLPISVVGGSYSISGGQPTSDSGILNPGETLTVFVQSSTQVEEETSATLFVGEGDAQQSASFTVKTASPEDEGAPKVEIMFPLEKSATTADKILVRISAEDISDKSGVPAVGLDTVTIAGNPVSVDSTTNTYHTNVDLSSGENTIAIRVADKNGNVFEKAISVTQIASGDSFGVGMTDGVVEDIDFDPVLKRVFAVERAASGAQGLYVLDTAVASFSQLAAGSIESPNLLQSVLFDADNNQVLVGLAHGVQGIQSVNLNNESVTYYNKQHGNFGGGNDAIISPREMVIDKNRGLIWIKDNQRLRKIELGRSTSGPYGAVAEGSNATESTWGTEGGIALDSVNDRLAFVTNNNSIFLVPIVGSDSSATAPTATELTLSSSLSGASSIAYDTLNNKALVTQATSLVSIDLDDGTVTTVTDGTADIGGFGKLDAVVFNHELGLAFVNDENKDSIIVVDIRTGDSAILIKK